MIDERIKKLANGLVNYSVHTKKGDNVLIHLKGIETYSLGKELVKEVYLAGGNPFVKIEDTSISRSIIENSNETTLEVMRRQDLRQMKEMDGYIAVRGSNNIYNLNGISNEKMEDYERDYMEDVLNERVDNTKWVILIYPTEGASQLAKMSNEDFEDFYFKVCTLDYAKMKEAMKSLEKLMKKTDKVEIKGPGTDLVFSIKGMGAIPCAGECNIPDGEVYTAPIKDSVNGRITYNAPSTYRNFTFENISLEFRNGKIINALANNVEKINEIFNTDEGARFIGEFAIGVNPYIIGPMNDILFDEKITGSFHFTPGRAYKDMDNGNISSIHWDLVCMQTPEYGGGEIYFDDVLIRKDGRFVIQELECLNPENLI